MVWGIVKSKVIFDGDFTMDNSALWVDVQKVEFAQRAVVSLNHTMGREKIGCRPHQGLMKLFKVATDFG